MTASTETNIEKSTKKSTKQQWILRQRPSGIPNREDVVLIDAPNAAPAAGELLIENRFFSLDPAIRGWMSDTPSYLPPIPLGDPIRATVAGRVLESRAEGFCEGDLVYGMGAWETHSTLPAMYFSIVPRDSTQPLQRYLSILGAVGMTSYFSIVEAARVSAGQTLLMSTAAGAVGSVAGQIAKIRGLRVVGIAGSDEKCRWVTDTLGFDGSINYNSTNTMEASIRQVCPEGVDVFFDNVGGEILDAALMNLNKDAMVLFCGSISSYNTDRPVPGPYNYWQILARSVTVQGFLVSDYVERFGEGQAQMSKWLESGQIQFREHIVEGMENCLNAYTLLFSGKNEGKLLVKL